MQKRLVADYTNGNFIRYFSCSLRMISDGIVPLEHDHRCRPAGSIESHSTVGYSFDCTWREIFEHYGAVDVF